MKHNRKGCQSVVSEATRQSLGVQRAASMPVKGGLQILRSRRACTKWKNSRNSSLLIMWLVISNQSILKKTIYHSTSLPPVRNTRFGRKYQHVRRTSRKYLWLFFNITPTPVKALRLGTSFCIPSQNSAACACNHIVTLFSWNFWLTICFFKCKNKRKWEFAIHNSVATFTALISLPFPPILYL